MKKLAILGASYLQIPLVKKAKDLGIETHCFAWDNPESVCKNICDFFYPISVLDKELILEKCIEIQIDGVTTIATDICMPTISYVAQKMNLISNSYESTIYATKKGLMRRRFEEYQIMSPKFIVLKKNDIEKTIDFNFPVIVKPTDRSGSRGVSKANNLDELELAFSLAYDESIEKKVIIEEFIEGSEVSVESISWQGKHNILAITDKITTGAPYFVEIEHHQPSILSDSVQEKIKKETIKCLNALDVKFGASHSEFKITNDEIVYVIEIGARMGGDFIGSHLVHLSTGYDFVEGVIDIALNQFSLPTIKQNNSSGIYFLSKETEYLLPYFKMPNEFDIDKKILKDNLINVKSSNDRSGFLIYKSNKKIFLL